MTPGKKVVGRKRHIAVDTDGRLLMVNLTVKSHPTATPFSRPKMTPYRCAGCRY
jgi:hypothetical protein